MLRGCRAAEILIKIFGVDACVPVPIGTDPRHRIARRSSLIREKYKGNTGRGHQAFLAGCDHEIDAPFVH